MNNALGFYLRRHAAIVYFVLALAIAWATELLLAASAQGRLAATIPPAPHYLASECKSCLMKDSWGTAR